MSEERTINAVSEGPVGSRGLLRIVRGDPTDDEVAALTVAIVALRAAERGSAEPPHSTVSRWNDPAARLRPPLHPGPGAWRASAWRGSAL